jgi:hypothetical protein
VVLAARRLGGGSSGDKGSCIGRLFEATEIATMEDKMLMEEVLIKTGRTSAYAERFLPAAETSGNVRIDLTGAHWLHHLDHLVHLVVPLKQADFGDATGMEELTAEDRWLLPPFCFFQLHRQVMEF